MPSQKPTSNAKPHDPPPTPATPTPPIDVTYSFVWSDLSAEKPRRHAPSTASRIRITSLPPNDNGSLRCSARFSWGSFLASFDCLYHPSTDTFSRFEVREETMRGGMEDIDGVEVCFQGGEGEGRSGEVRDDRGERFLVVEMDLGYSGCVEAGVRVYGKKFLREEKWEGVELSRGERVRLGISDERWEGAVVVRDEEDVDE